MHYDACDVKCAWDVKLQDELVTRWRKWEKGLPLHVEVPRALVNVGEPINNIALHAFGDASGCGVAAAIYAIVQQESSINQGPVVARARLAHYTSFSCCRLHGSKFVDQCSECSRWITCGGLACLA